MIGLDLWTAVMSAVTCVCLGLRANMLKPGFSSWCSAPRVVWMSLLTLSLGAAITGLSIVRGGTPATAREAIVMTALAASALVMLVNLYRQTRDDVVPEAPASSEQKQ